MRPQQPTPPDQANPVRHPQIEPGWVIVIVGAVVVVLAQRVLGL